MPSFSFVSPMATPTKGMVMREKSLCLLLGLLLIVHYGSGCVPAQCVMCRNPNESLPVRQLGNQSDSCPLCSETCVNASLPACKRDFEIYINSTGSKAEEGDDITLTCEHDIPSLNLTCGWIKNGKEVHNGRNQSQLVLKRVLADKKGQYTCFVSSSCGLFRSRPHDVTVKNNSVVLLIICGVSALTLVLIMGIILKYKLKKRQC